MKRDGIPESLPPASAHPGPPNSWTPGSSTCCHCGHPRKAGCGRGNNQAKSSMWCWPRRSQSRLEGSVVGGGDSSPVGSVRATQKWVHTQRGSCPKSHCHIPSPAAIAQDNLPANLKRHGAGEKGTKGRREEMEVGPWRTSRFLPFIPRLAHSYP